MADQWTALYVAYSIVWVGIFGFLLYLSLRHRKIERDIRNLKEEVLKHGKST